LVNENQARSSFESTAAGRSVPACTETRPVESNSDSRQRRTIYEPIIEEKGLFLGLQTNIAEKNAEWNCFVLADKNSS
jgi:hypothetical protein